MANAIRSACIAAGLALFAASTAAHAEDGLGRTDAPLIIHTEPFSTGVSLDTADNTTEVPTGLTRAPDLGTVSDSDLDGYRGGQAIVVGNQTLDSVISGNTINGNYLAGAVTIGDNAFSNFTGLGNIAINTGAQVSLQSGVNITINVGQ